MTNPSMATRVADPPTVDHAPDIDRFFVRAPRGFDVPVAIEGRLPDFARGSYYAIGPGRFTVGDVRYRHWLDGDGFVLAVHFEGASGGEAPRARAVGRFVDGAKQVEEAAAGRATYRTFGTAFAGDRLRRGLGLMSPTNVSVHPWRGELLAYGEQALPYRLDPVTLETRDEHDFGRLSPASPLSAHPFLDPETGALFNFGIGFSPSHPTLTFYRFDADGALELRRRHAIEDPVSVHDFALSERYAVFDLAPYILDFSAFRDGASLFDAMSWRPDRRRVLLVLDRETGDEVARIAMPTGYCLHLVDAWGGDARQTDGTLVVEMLELESPIYDQYRIDSLFDEARPSRAVRYEVDVASATIRRRIELDDRAMCDFPVSDPRCRGRGEGCRSFFASAISQSALPGRKFFDRLVRFEWPSAGGPPGDGSGDGSGGVVDAWQAPRGTYLGGEAGFVPDPDRPDAGAIVLPVGDPRRGASHVLVFDAGDLASGPVARIALPELLPPLFHAWFAEGRHVGTNSDR